MVATTAMNGLGVLVFSLRALVSVSSSAGAPTSLAITVLGQAEDPRAIAVQEAVTFWNGQLNRVGANVRLGPVRLVDDSISDDALRELSRAVMGGRRADDLSEQVQGVPGEIVVALSEAEFVSFAVPWSRQTKGFVALRRADVPPLSLPNVARNMVAHELGHVLGLDHNDDPRTLMCGRPAPCRPTEFSSAREHFFSLTTLDEQDLRETWR